MGITKQDRTDGMVKATMNIQPVMIRYHPRSKAIDLFIPDMPAKEGYIACYNHIGQHSEASLRYYNETKPLHYAGANFKAAAQLLLEEYQGICELHGQKMKVVMRDTPLFRSARWDWRNAIPR